MKNDDVTPCAICQARDVTAAGGPHMFGVPDDLSLICGVCAAQLHLSSRVVSVAIGTLLDGRTVQLTTSVLGSGGEPN